MKSRSAWIVGASLVVVVLEATANLVPAADVPAEFQPNYDEGHLTGYPVGYRSGVVDGKVRGKSEGTDAGNSDGYSAGWVTTYQPAFDYAYDAFYPQGHVDGWKVGIDAGFDEGMTWARRVLESIRATNFGTSASAGTFVISGRNFNSHIDLFGGAGSVTLSTSIGSNWLVDWAAHYYGVGYKDGRDEGYAAGDEWGYQRAYPVAYKIAYRSGFRDGSQQGYVTGLQEGGDVGFSDGWGAGYGEGWDFGFAAGADYGFYGEFVAPKYTPAFSYRSSGARILQMPIPEPSAFAMLVGVLGFLSARRQRV